MTYEFRFNGNQTLIVRPSDEIERLILTGMSDASEKGKTITLSRTGDGDGWLDAFKISVQR